MTQINQVLDRYEADNNKREESVSIMFRQVTHMTSLGSGVDKDKRDRERPHNDATATQRQQQQHQRPVASSKREGKGIKCVGSTKKDKGSGLIPKWHKSLPSRGESRAVGR